MSSDNENSPPQSPTGRRSSFSGGSKLSGIFGRSPPNSNGNSTMPGPIATAAANAQAHQRRRTSLASLSMAGSPTQTSGSFANMRNRQSSISGSSSSPSTSIEESAVEDGDAPNTPSSPFARRMSFGAKALRDRTGTGNANGRSSNHVAPSVKGRGEGFDWSEQIKNRAERSASISTRAGGALPPKPPSPGHHKAASVPEVPQPVKAMPKAPQKPDHFQERILKGDFYMD